MKALLLAMTVVMSLPAAAGAAPYFYHYASPVQRPASYQQTARANAYAGTAALPGSRWQCNTRPGSVFLQQRQVLNAAANANYWQGKISGRPTFPVYRLHR